MVTPIFIRIPKSASTSIMHSVISANPEFNFRHRTVDEIGRDNKFFTMIRDPLQQYCSAYYFAKNNDYDIYDPENFMLTPFIEHMDVINQTDTLEEYLLNCPQNAFLGKYLCGLSPFDLESVGHIDFMSDSRKLFNVMFGLPITDVWHRKNPQRTGDYVVSSDIHKKFIQRNELEYELYAQGFEHFNNLKYKHNI